ncbi:MAG: hypothetical protein EXQ50_12900 [Acidobacteria bacterium]|nr:hypothetical protein [Acidobacteriota bacterium]MSO62966.1 hypothetical protein [Acidobacteriota bacterium]
MIPERPFDAGARAQTAEWLKNWARVGPLLESRRVVELRQLTSAEAARVAVELLWPMVPRGPGDDGAGLGPMHDVLRRLAGRA